MIVLIDLNFVEFYQPLIKADLADKRLLIMFTCDAHTVEEDPLDLFHIMSSHDCSNERG